MATAYVTTSYHEWQPWQANQNTLTLTGSFTPATLAINDTFKFFLINPNTTIQHIGMIFPDVDSNGAPLFTWDLGDSSSATLFVSASTVGQSAGSLTTVTALPKAYSAADYLILTVHAAPATAVLGAIKFLVNLSVDATTNVL